MLILSRQNDEEVIITIPPTKGPRRVSVMVTDIQGDKVKLGFVAADDVEINRGEVQKNVDKQVAKAG